MTDPPTPPKSKVLFSPPAPPGPTTDQTTPSPRNNNNTRPRPHSRSITLPLPTQHGPSNEAHPAFYTRTFIDSLPSSPPISPESLKRSYQLRPAFDPNRLTRRIRFRGDKDAEQVSDVLGKRRRVDRIEKTKKRVNRNQRVLQTTLVMVGLVLMGSFLVMWGSISKKDRLMQKEVKEITSNSRTTHLSPQLDPRPVIKHRHSSKPKISDTTYLPTPPATELYTIPAPINQNLVIILPIKSLHHVHLPEIVTSIRLGTKHTVSELSIIIATPENLEFEVEHLLGIGRLQTTVETAKCKEEDLDLSLCGMHHVREMIEDGKRFDRVLMMDFDEGDLPVNVKQQVELLSSVMVDESKIDYGPLGLVGATLNSNHFKVVAGLSHFGVIAPQEEGNLTYLLRPVAFLLPPLIFDAKFLLEIEVGVPSFSSGGEAGLWYWIGGRFTDRLGNGGWVLKGHDLQYDGQGVVKEKVRQSLVSGQVASKQQGHLYKHHHHRLKYHRDNIPTGLLVIILGEESHLHSFAPAICGFITTGHSVHITVIQNHLDWDDPEAIWYESHIESPCHLHYDSIPPAALEEWVEDIKQVPDIYIYGDQIRNSYLLLMERAVSAGRLEVNLIALPADQMSLLEWMGSLDLIALQNWSKPQININVIANSPPKAFSNLLTSLKALHVYGDQVSLSINVDKMVPKATKHLVEELDWSYGSVATRKRINAEPTVTDIVESWTPHNNHSYEILIEGETELSPMAYGWAKLAVLQYRYSASSGGNQGIGGVSLIQPRTGAHLGSNNIKEVIIKKEFDPELPYLYQMVPKGGMVWFPEFFGELQHFMESQLTKKAHSHLEDIIPNLPEDTWLGTCWQQHALELFFLGGYTMIFPAYSNSTSLARSTTHIPTKGSSRLKVTSGTLMKSGHDLLEMTGRRLPPVDRMAHVDLYGEVVDNETLLARGSKRKVELASLKSHHRIVKLMQNKQKATFGSWWS